MKGKSSKKSIKNPAKTHKVGKGKNTPLKKYKRRRPPPLEFFKSEQPKNKKFSKKNSVKYSLKYMPIQQIRKIYDSIKKQNIDFTFGCKILPSVHGRDMVKITSINGKKLYNDLVFYKSTGTSRNNNSLKNIWFPCGEQCISPISKRITKAENKFLLRNNNLQNQVNIENNSYRPNNNTPFLSKYGRFINKNNAMISKMLGEGFVCKS